MSGRAGRLRRRRCVPQFDVSRREARRHRGHRRHADDRAIRIAGSRTWSRPIRKAWVTAENQLTDSALATWPSRAPLRTRLTELFGQERTFPPEHRGARYFWLRSDGVHDLPYIMSAASLDEPGTVILDANALAEHGKILVRRYERRALRQVARLRHGRRRRRLAGLAVPRPRHQRRPSRAALEHQVLRAGDRSGRRLLQRVPDAAEGPGADGQRSRLQSVLPQARHTGDVRQGRLRASRSTELAVQARGDQRRPARDHLDWRRRGRR